jgi:hypothetical protein
VANWQLVIWLQKSYRMVIKCPACH